MVTIKRLECDVFGWRKYPAETYQIIVTKVGDDKPTYEWTKDLSEQAVDRVEQAIEKALQPTAKVAREREIQNRKEVTA